jgi:hypothetical protein
VRLRNLARREQKKEGKATGPRPFRMRLKFAEMGLFVSAETEKPADYDPFAVFMVSDET